MALTDVFLTHDWGMDEQNRNNHDRVKIVNEALKRRGYRTWFDNDKMHGDIPTQMAHGIDNTKAVLIFVTQRYMEKVNGINPNDNCKLEYLHATRTKTRDGVLCVVMEKRMLDTNKWDGILGLYCGSKMYVDMNGDLDDASYLQAQVELLCGEIETFGIPKPDPNAKRESVVSPVRTAPKVCQSFEGYVSTKPVKPAKPADTSDMDVVDACQVRRTPKGKERLVFTDLDEKDMGTDGILYTLGTHFGTKDYGNPGDEKKFLTVSRSTHGGGEDCLGEVTAFTGRDAVHSHTKDALHSFYMIELKAGLTVCPTAYKLRSYDSGGGHMLINWNFEASDDGTNWTVLKSHKDDRTITSFGAIGRWNVKSDESFKYFRVLLTGKTATNTQYLCVSGFELYGSLEVNKFEDEERNTIMLNYLNPSELGTDGILYVLGTDFKSQEDYSNPGIENHFLKVSRSTHGDGEDCLGEVTAFTGREAVHSHTLSALNSFYMIELKQGLSVCPTAYKLRSYGDGDGDMLITWNFEASNDGENWNILKGHKDDKTIEKFGAIGCWDILSDNYFKYFRILLTGKTTNNTEYLCVSGFELYGSLKME